MRGGRGQTCLVVLRRFVPWPVGDTRGMGWTLVGAPLNSSAESGGEAHAPAALRAAGICARLRADDVGDIEGRVGPAERDAESGRARALRSDASLWTVT
jgi:hypothetical protein